MAVTRLAEFALPTLGVKDVRALSRRIIVVPYLCLGLVFSLYKISQVLLILILGTS